MVTHLDPIIYCYLQCSFYSNCSSFCRVPWISFRIQSIRWLHLDSCFKQFLSFTVIVFSSSAALTTCLLIAERGFCLNSSDFCITRNHKNTWYMYINRLSKICCNSLVQWLRHLTIRVMITTEGNWFQRNPLENVCVFYQWKRYRTSVANLINICRCFVVT